MKNIFILALALGVSGSAFADLTTMYGSNNSGSMGGMVYFDATVNATALTVTGFDTNYAGTDAFGYEVWTISGSYAGNTGSNAGWTMVATGTGVGAGLDAASAVTLSNSFTLAASSTTGFALRLFGGSNNAGHRYTNGTGANQAYSNSDLSLSLGGATNSPFDGSEFSPRVWNGTIKYTTSTVPEPASLAVLGLGALALVRRRRTVK